MPPLYPDRCSPNTARGNSAPCPSSADRQTSTQIRSPRIARKHDFVFRHRLRLVAPKLLATTIKNTIADVTMSDSANSCHAAKTALYTLCLQELCSRTKFSVGPSSGWTAKYGGHRIAVAQLSTGTHAGIDSERWRRYKPFRRHVGFFRFSTHKQQGLRPPKPGCAKSVPSNSAIC